MHRALAALALLAAVSLSGCSAAIPYTGPRSDHFDGERFHNPIEREERGFGDVLRWKLGGGRAAPWPVFVPVAPGPPPPARVSRGVRVTFINHATTLIQMGGVNILTDPVWSDVVGPTEDIGQRRRKPPGIDFASLPRIDAVVISHNHYDHLDLPTLRRLDRRDAPLVIAGLGTAALLRRHGVGRARDLDWWQHHDLDGVRVTFAPAQHWSTRGLGDRNRNLWGSYHIASATHSVYFAGDTGDGPHFRAVRDRLGPPTIALLPIGAYEPRWFMRSQHIDPAGAVAAHLALGARRSLGIHWGTFRQSDESMTAPITDLARARAAAGVRAEDFVVVENGRAIYVP